MTQHINLLRKRSGIQSIAALGPLVLPLLILVMLGFAGHWEWRLMQLRESQAKSQQAIDGLRKALEMRRRAAGLNESEAMSREIATFKSQIEARRDWNDLLQKGELGTHLGYSGILRTLAGLHEDGVWLKGIDITKGGQMLSLSGNATNADAVVRYIAQVNEAFKPMNIQFSSMEIAREAPKTDTAPAGPAGVLSFKLF